MKFRDHAFATDHGQGNQHTDGLGQGGAKRRACGTKLQQLRLIEEEYFFCCSFSSFAFNKLLAAKVDNILFNKI